MAGECSNIRKRKDGRWEGRYKIYSPEKGKPVYRSLYGKSLEEVKEKLTEKQKTINDERAERKAGANPAYVSPLAFSLEAAAKDWLEEVRQQKKHSTYVKYSLTYRKYLEPKLKNHFKNAALQTTDSWDASSLIPDSLSLSTRKGIYCVLKQILQYASENYSLPVPKIDRPRENNKKRPAEVFTMAEQAKLLSALHTRTDIYKAAILLCLYTGMRLGEACALKRRDIDFENRILRISRTVQRIYAGSGRTKTVLLETEPKSACSIREIPLSDYSLKLLYSVRDKGEYLFAGAKPLEPRTVQFRFKKILEAAGLPGKNFHALRHTFATNCVEGGMDVKSLSEILGHADVKITLNRYVHPSMDTKRKFMDGLSAFYGRIYGQAV